MNAFRFCTLLFLPSDSENQIGLDFSLGVCIMQPGTGHRSAYRVLTRVRIA